MHPRFVQQARWTQDLRNYLFNLAGLGSARRVLEVGCGTGAVLGSLPSSPNQTTFGIDIDYTHLGEAARNVPSAIFTGANAHKLPFSTGSFDIVFCHFLLLWLTEPPEAVREMVRVCRSGGWVLAFAEPDYGGRIDYPQSLEQIGREQAQVLVHQGANPNTGRALFSWLNASGLINVTGGVMGGQWKHPGEEEWKEEWAQLNADLAGAVEPRALQRCFEIETAARREGSRILFVPTFYAAGMKPVDTNDRPDRLL